VNHDYEKIIQNEKIGISSLNDESKILINKIYLIIYTIFYLKLKNMDLKLNGYDYKL
jgi:hypothetical protein